MYPSNCTDFTIGGQSNCTVGTGSRPPPPPAGHDEPQQPHPDHDGNIFGEIFDFVGGLLKSMVGGDKHEKRSMEPVYVV